MENWEPDLPQPSVVCTIVKIVGSAPSQVGAKMRVAADEFRGTLGGGEFEHRVMKYARELLRMPEAGPHLKEYVLCKEMGQCCGGRAEVFFEPIRRRKRIHLFGGGHVGRAAAQVLSRMPFDVVVIDPRPEWAERSGMPSDVRAILADPVEYAGSRAWDGCDAVCIFTHSHDLDYRLVRHFVERPVGYLGLIGSEHKADVFLARLRSETPEGEKLVELWEEKMHCPIGLPLDSKNPKIIAVSIAAELLKEWGLRKQCPGATACVTPAKAPQEQHLGQLSSEMFPRAGVQTAEEFIPPLDSRFRGNDDSEQLVSEKIT